jgi:UrcA family protein
VVASRVVRFADLDLANAKDVVTLYRRIGWAAHFVCLDNAFVSDAASAMSMRLCVAAATEQAISDINRPTLTALHHSKTTRVPG